MTQADAERAARAAQRRATWRGEVVAAGTPKPALHEHTTVEERLAAMTRLCRELWLASGRPIVRCERGDWPGEVFEVECGRPRSEP